MPDEEKLFYSIGEVAELLQLKPYVLRYWETEFKKLTPKKSFTGQRTYKVRDIQLASTIKKLLYEDKYTIAGAVQKLEELDAKGELAAFANTPSEPTVSAGFGDTPKAATPPAEPAAEAADPQKVKDLKSLLEATKKLLKKYNL